MNKLRTLLAFTCILSISAAAQAPSDAVRDLQAAINKEVVEGDLNSAIALYSKILSRYASQRDIAAKALLHIGECHEKLGHAEARKIYERVINEFGDQKDITAEAHTRLASSAGSQTEGVTRRLIDSSGDCLFASGDDEWAACSRSGNLYVRNLSSGIEILTARNVGREDLVALSTDGAWVAFNSNGNDRQSLWLSAADGSSRRKLEGPPSVPRSVAFSRDNSVLFAFYSKFDRPGEIWLHRVDARQGQKVSESRELKSVTSPVFSPDGQYVFYRAGWERAESPQIWVLPVRGGEPWGFSVLKRGTPVGFTADGRLVVHAPGNIGTLSLWAVTLREGHAEGEPQLLARNVIPAGQYHSSGKYYFSRQSGRRDVLTANVSDALPVIAKPATDSQEGRGASPDYSPDGKHLAFLRPGPSDRVVVRNLETGFEKEYDPKATRLSRVRWYPDGAALLLFGSVSTTEDVGMRFDLTSGEVTKVFRVDGKHADASFNPTVSADGKYVYYKRFYASSEPRRVHRFEINTGKEEEVYRAPKASDGLRIFSISPDNTRIAVVCSNEEGHWIGVAPLAGGETRIIHRVPKPAGMRGFSGLAWTGDGKSILFHVMESEGSDSLWRVASDGSPAQRLLTATGIIGSISAHPNGGDIAFSSAETRRELWMIDGLK